VNEPPVSISGPSGAPETPLAYRVVRGGLWMAASSYFAVGFGFLANLALTRILAPEHYGIFALAQFLFSVINVRTKIGIGSAFAQQKEITGELVGTYLALDVAAGAVSLLVAGVLTAVLGALGYSRDIALVMLVLAVAGFVESFASTPWVLLDRGLSFGRTSLVTSIAFPISYVPAFWLALNGAGYWSLVVQPLAYGALLVVGMWWSAHRSLPQIWRLRWRFDWGTSRSLLRFGSFVGLAEFGGLLTTQLDNFLVGTVVGVVTLGFYDRAYRIAYWPGLLLSNVVNHTAFYTYARLQDDLVRLQKTVVMTQWLTTSIALPLAVAVFAAAPDLVTLLYGERWLPSALFLRFLVIYSAARPLMDNAGSLFTAVGRPRLKTLTVFLEVAILVLAGLPLTFAFGAVGTAVAVGLASGTGLIVRLALVRQIVALRLWETLLAPAAAAALALASVVLLNRALGTSDWSLVARVVTKAAYGAGAFFAILLILQPRLTRERIRYTWQLAMRRRETGAP
jgi:PST family polysaccharide transporter